jgi:hypothetical protein
MTTLAFGCVLTFVPGNAGASDPVSFGQGRGSATWRLLEKACDNGHWDELRLSD